MKHLFALHLIYLPRIKQSSNIFHEGWNDHGLRTVHNMSLCQLFVSGALHLRESGLASLDFFDQVNLIMGLIPWELSICGCWYWGCPAESNSQKKIWNCSGSAWILWQLCNWIVWISSWIYELAVLPYSFIGRLIYRIDRQHSHCFVLYVNVFVECIKLTKPDLTPSQPMIKRDFEWLNL